MGAFQWGQRQFTHTPTPADFGDGPQREIIASQQGFGFRSGHSKTPKQRRRVGLAATFRIASSGLTADFTQEGEQGGVYLVGLLLVEEVSAAGDELGPQVGSGPLP